MLKAETVEELASLISVDSDTFVSTFERFNEFALKGEDPDFKRGQSAYDTFNGDQSQEGISATLQPLATPPYYAIKVEGGALGTNGGPKTDANCRVLSLNGGVINGLYAAECDGCTSGNGLRPGEQSGQYDIWLYSWHLSS